MSQPPLSGSGATSLPPRRSAAAVSPSPSDTSDSDISLGTHSPVPSSISLQHSPGSTSGGGNDRDERLIDDRDRDRTEFRGYSSLGAFRFDVHSPGTMSNDIRNLLPRIQPLGDDSERGLTQPQLAGAFAGRFMPALPYRLGDHSPSNNTHSPPIGHSHLTGVTPTVLRPQPQMPTNVTANGSPTIIPAPATMSPLRIRVTSPSRLNSELNTTTTHSLIQSVLSDVGSIIRIVQPTQPLTLHRPFSPSPKPKDHS